MVKVQIRSATLLIIFLGWRDSLNPFKYCENRGKNWDKTKIGENVKTLGTICKQFQHIEPEDTEEEKARKKFYNSILADKKPYFFRYKYKQLSKDYNAYIKKTDQNARSHLYTTLEDLLEKEKMESQGVSTLTEE